LDMRQPPRANRNMPSFHPFIRVSEDLVNRHVVRQRDDAGG
jgi:hypothetical protein